MSVSPRESIERLVESEIGHRWGLGPERIRLELPAEVEDVLLKAIPYTVRRRARAWRNMVRIALEARGVLSPMVLAARRASDADPTTALVIEPGVPIIGRAP